MLIASIDAMRAMRALHRDSRRPAAESVNFRGLGLVALLGVAPAIAACGDDTAGGGGSGGGSGGASGSSDASASTDSGSPTSSGNGSGATGSSANAGGSAPTSSSSSSPDTSSASASSGGSATFAEMCGRPGVLFCDGFEQAWDASWLEDGGEVTIVDGAAVAGEGSTVVELTTYGDIQSSKLLRTFDAVDQVYVRFDVQYDQAYDNTGGSHGLILGGSDAPPWGMLGTAGMQPNGSDFFVLNFEPDGTVGQGAELGFYAYFMNMQPDGNGDYWGNIFTSTLEPGPVIVPGQWHCAEYGITLNAPGAQDGRAAFWFDGLQHGDFGGFEWRSDPSMGVSTFALDSYNHMNDGPIPAETPNKVRYDNLVISTSPVGCL